jgi:flagellin
MADITLNSAVRSNLRTLQSTTDLMNRTETRLSTGKKVNSALDNPSSFFTAQALDRRASDLTSLLDSVSSSVKTLEAADNGIKAITDVVESLKATARSALQSPSPVATKAFVQSADVAGLTGANLLGTSTTTPAAAGALSFTFGGSTALGTGESITFDFAVDGGTASTITIDEAAVQAAGNGNATIDDADELREILTAELGSGVTVGGTGSAITITSNTTGATSEVEISSYDASGLTATDSTGLADQSDAGADASSTGGLSGQTLIVKDRAGADVTITFGTSTGQVDTLDELNQAFEDNDVALTASVSTSGANGKLKIEAANSAANEVPAAIAGTIVTGSGAAFSASGAATFAGRVYDAGAKEKRDNYRDDYNNALKQISSLAKDASFNGVNLLNGDDLDIVFNEDGTSKLNVKGTVFSATGLGLGDLTGDEFLDADSINEVISTIENTFASLEAQASKFGSQLQIVETRETFTKDMVGTLEDGALALVGADTNAEAANLATLQTRQALIVSSLSISTQQESNVLQLLR